jgi:hypothetical protein
VKEKRKCSGYCAEPVDATRKRWIAVHNFRCKAKSLPRTYVRGYCMASRDWGWMGRGASFSYQSVPAALFQRTIQGRMRGQNPERRRSGGYRDASTAQRGRSVLPTSLSMTKGVIAFGKLRPDRPGPLDSRGRLSPHELECSGGGGVAVAKCIGPSSGEERPPQDDSSCLDSPVASR